MDDAFPQYSLLPSEIQHQILSGSMESLNQVMRTKMLHQKIENDLLCPPTRMELRSYLETLPSTVVFLTYSSDGHDDPDGIYECRPYRYTVGSYVYEPEVLYTLDDAAAELKYFTDNDDNSISSEDILRYFYGDYSIGDVPDKISYDLLTMNYIYRQRLLTFGVTSKPELDKMVEESTQKYLAALEYKNDDDAFLPIVFMYLYTNAKLLGIQTTTEKIYLQTPRQFNPHAMIEVLNTMIKRLENLIMKRIKFIEWD